MHGTDSTSNGGGMSEDSGVAKDNDLYEPWMIVTRKKMGQRGAKNAAGLEDYKRQGKADMHQASGQGPTMKTNSMGWAKEANAQKFIGPESSIKANELGPFKVGRSTDGHEPSPHLSPSVRSKKGLARNRGNSIPSNVESRSPQSWNWRISDGRVGRPEGNFKFTTVVQSEVGFKAKGKKEKSDESDVGFKAKDKEVIGRGKGSDECSIRPGGCEVGEGSGLPECHQAEPGIQGTTAGHPDSATQAESLVQHTHFSKGSDQVDGGGVVDLVPKEGLDTAKDGEAGMDIEDGGGAAACV